MLIWSGITQTPGMKIELEALLLAMYPDDPDNGVLRLFQNNITPSQFSVLADFTQADFSGYASVNLTEAQRPTSRIDALGNVYAVDALVRHFAQSGTGSVNTVYGWYIISGSDVVAAGRFDTPIEFDTTGRVLDLELGYRINQGQAVAGIDATVGTDI